MNIEKMTQCAVLLAVLITAGCNSQSASGAKDEMERLLAEPEFTAKEIGQIKGLSGFFGTPFDITLFEGMPHPMFEEGLLKQQISSNAVLDIDGQKFYKRPQSFADEDKAQVLNLLSAESTHKPYVWGKLCGGFHADFALRWKGRDGAITLLICLGCHELVILGPKTKLRTDISNDAYTQLKSLLTKYQKLRPKSERSQAN